MYAVSNDYKEAIKKPAIRTKVDGTIDGIPFDDNNILTGSFSISNQNSDNSAVQIGTVYIGELNITLRNIDVERYSLDGKKIIPNFYLNVRGDWEKVPLGVYYISEANYTAAGIEVKAYDVMSKLDKRFSGETMTGRPYDLFKYACEKCNVELATTRSDIFSFANGDEILATWQEGNDIETWRDYISWLAQACCCFATASRDGKLIIKPYGRNIVDNIDSDERFKGASFSDYETRYTGIYVTNIADNIMNYYGQETDDALTYSLGANPFLQFGTEINRERIRRAVLDGLSAVKYVPFSAEIPENPAYDLGDVIRFSNGLADPSKMFCINKYTWNYHRSIKIEGCGENPSLATAQSKVDKNISGIINKIDAAKTIVYNFVNIDPVTIETVNKEILTIDYYAKDSTTAMFLAEILIDITADGISPLLTVTYSNNETIISDFIPQHICNPGKQIVTLFLPLPLVEQNSSNRFTVMLKLEGGTGYIEAQHIRATISGQGLVSEKSEWDGRIRLSEYITRVSVNDFDITVEQVDDNLSVTRLMPNSTTASDNVRKIQITGFGISINNLSGNLTINEED